MTDPARGERDPIAELDALVADAGIRVSFSAHCRSGWIGELCRCWRCRGEKGPTADEGAAERDAEIMDAAYQLGMDMGRLCEKVKRG